MSDGRKRGEARQFAEERVERTRQFAEGRVEDARQFAEGRVEDARQFAEEKVEDARQFAEGRVEEARLRAEEAAELVLSDERARRYAEDFGYRAIVNTYVSLAVNQAFAAAKIAMSVFYSSLWFAAIGAYYIILSAARAVIVLNMHRIERIGDARAKRLCELRVCRVCGFLLVVLTAALLCAVWQMVTQGQSNHYPGPMLFVAAAFSTYSVVGAALRLARVRKGASPIVTAAVCISLASALVSTLMLQTSLLSALGGLNARAVQAANAATGTAVCASILIMAAVVVGHTQSEINALRCASLRRK